VTPRDASPRGRTLLIDTNLLLLLVVGAFAPEQIERFKRTRAYSIDDYVLLSGFAGGFAQLLATPNIRTEVSNLAGQLAEPARSGALAALGSLVLNVEEQYLASQGLVAEKDFLRFGLTDVGILTAARERVAVITDDLPLYARLASMGAEVTNFHHIRVAAA
jgi:hypothetical protein